MRPDIHICALVLPLCASSLAHTNYYYHWISHNSPPTTTLPRCPPYKTLPTTNIATTSTVSSLTHSSSSRPTVSTGWIYSGAHPLSVPSLQWTGVAALEKSSPSLFHLFAPPTPPRTLLCNVTLTYQWLVVALLTNLCIRCKQRLQSFHKSI